MSPKTLNLTGVVLLLAVALWSPTSHAATVEEGLAALNAQNYGEAIKILRPLADGGDPQAQYFVGTMYRDGKGLPQDQKVSCEWFEKSAEQGPPPAMHMTGLCYRLGLPGAVDNAKAAFWLKKAVERGYVPSMCVLGDLYATGSGVEKSPERTFELCQQSAKAGDPGAQYKLGLLYMSGFGTEQNPTQAANWVGTAAITGDAAAQLTLGEFYWNGFGLEQDRNKAYVLFKASGDQGFGPALLHVGKLLLNEAQSLDGSMDGTKIASAYVWLTLADINAANAANREEAKSLADRIRPALQKEILDEAQGIVDAWRPKPPQTQLIKPAAP